MVFQIIGFLGLIIGIILAKEFRNELKDIKNFIKIISFIVISGIIIRLILLANFSLMFFVGLLIGLITNYFIKNNYLYYGSSLMLASSMHINDEILFSILIFILGLTQSALKKINRKFLLISLILFALPFTFLLTNLNYGGFIIGFSIGGLAIGINQFNK